jgi:hypothetical protein
LLPSKRNFTAATETVRQMAPVFIGAALLWGCTNVRTTSPPRSAQEELLITTAADKAAERLAAQLPSNISAFIDSSHFAVEDAPYAVAEIDDQLMRKGIRLTDDRAHASTVIELRAGALSTDEQTTLVGLPPLPLPFFPAGNFVSIPGFELFRRQETAGVAKFAATVYDPKTGRLIVSTNPQYGVVREADYVLLFVFTWSDRDPSLDHPGEVPPTH